MNTRPTIRLRTKRAASPAAHPWIFWKDVVAPESKIPPGTVVTVEDDTGAYVGRGFYSGHARVQIRLLTSEEIEVDAAFFEQRLAEALALRTRLGIAHSTNAVRLVNSEGDALSGLIVDRFNDVIVLEYKAAGMYRFHDTIVGWLKNQFPGAKVVAVCDAHVQKQESFNFKHAGEPVPTEVQESGTTFGVLAGGGHKTGFFLDQRENRQAVAALAQGQSLLDLCAYTGGFSVTAARTATEVTAVDHDPLAAAALTENAARNKVQVTAHAEDVFKFLQTAVSQQRRWQVVVLDPWRMTKSRQFLPQAEATYLDLNRLALQVVAPGGLLLTCSCTGNLSEEAFLKIVTTAAAREKRFAQIFRLSGAAADHPFAFNAPEGRYLKAVWARVQ